MKFAALFNKKWRQFDALPPRRWKNCILANPCQWRFEWLGWLACPWIRVEGCLTPIRGQRDSTAQHLVKREKNTKNETEEFPKFCTDGLKSFQDHYPCSWLSWYRLNEPEIPMTSTVGQQWNSPWRWSLTPNFRRHHFFMIQNSQEAQDMKWAERVFFVSFCQRAFSYLGVNQEKKKMLKFSVEKRRLCEKTIGRNSSDGIQFGITNLMSAIDEW